MKNLKLIKFIVFIMTFLLVFLTLMIAHRFIGKHNAVKERPDFSLEEPEGSGIKSVSVENNTLYILVQGGNKSDRILIYDPQKQKKLYQININ